MIAKVHQCSVFVTNCVFCHRLSCVSPPLWQPPPPSCSPTMELATLAMSDMLVMLWAMVVDRLPTYQCQSRTRVR